MISIKKVEWDIEWSPSLAQINDMVEMLFMLTYSETESVSQVLKNKLQLY